MNNLDFSPLINEITKSINFSTILTIMVDVIASTVGIFLIVWGSKLIINYFQIVLNNGSIERDGLSSNSFSYLVYNNKHKIIKSIDVIPSFHRKRKKSKQKYKEQLNEKEYYDHYERYGEEYDPDGF